MKIKLVVTAAALAALAAAQTMQRRAVVNGNGASGEGRCTVEVVVDGSAEVQIQGETGTLRNLAGQAPQWRRFECTGVMPVSGFTVRFSPLEGRGQQQLVSDPRNGGPAVVRIDDPEGGAGDYTFELTWNNGGGDRPPYTTNQPYPQQRSEGAPRYSGDEDSYHRNREEYFRGDRWQDSLFQRVREDLEHVQSRSFPGSGDQYRLDAASRELSELQGRLDSGNYDSRDLGDVLRALQQVVQDNRVSDQDRQILTDDMERLRQFQQGGYRPR